MKMTKTTKKNAKKTTKPNIEFYVVSWADYDHDAEILTSGTLSDIYSTQEKARAAIMRCIKDVAKDIADNYDDWKEDFEVEDLNGLVGKMVLRDTGDFILTNNPDNGTEGHYTIQKFSTKYIK